MVETIISRVFLTIVSLPILVFLFFKIKFMDEDYATGKKEKLRCNIEETDEIHGHNKIILIVLFIFLLVLYGLFMYVL